MPFLPGARLGPYEIVSLLGAGGMGEVYKALDTRLNRSVAVKVSDARFSDRFQREAHAIASLNHPNICQLYDVGPNYLVMELVEGRPIGPADSLRKLLDAAVQIADAMAAAHAAGIVHRDLKPGNILITLEGRVKVLDFGLARFAGISSEPAEATRTIEITDPGTTVGTCAYMSPEQARGKPPLSAQSDQFSFGLILYELITGKRPFQRDSGPEIMAAIIREEAPPLPDRVPVPLRWVIERLLAKDPSDRYESTSDLYRELRNIRERLAEAGSGSLPAATVPRSRGFLPKIGFAGACMLVGALLASILTAVFETRPPSYRFSPLSREEATEWSPEWSPDGKSIAYTAIVHGIAQVFTKAVGAPDAAQLTRSLENCVWPFWSKDAATLYYTTESGLWAIAATGGAPQLILDHATATALHPDGKTAVFFRAGKLWVGPLQGGSPRQFGQAPLPASANIIWARFSRDGARLAVEDARVPGAGGDIWILPYPAGTPRRIGTGGNEASWFPDSRHLAVLDIDIPGDRHSLSVYDVLTGRGKEVYSSPDGLRSPSVSPDGRRIAYAKAAIEWDIIEVSVPSGAVRALQAGGGFSWMPSWAPSGSHYLMITNRSGVYAIEDVSLKEGFARRLLEIPRGSFADQPEWAPDGIRFTFGLFSSGSEKLMLSNSASVSTVPLDPGADRSFSASWSPDGQWVAYVRAKTGVDQLVKIRPGVPNSVVVLANARHPVGSVAWSPAGTSILYSMGDGLGVISPDDSSARTLTNRSFYGGFSSQIAGFSKDGHQVFGVFHNTAGGDEWQLYSVDVGTGAERLLGSLNLPPYIGSLEGFSLYPGENRFATSIAKWPYDIWMIEGVNPTTNWLTRLLYRFVVSPVNR